jgi:hypothetical protein
MPKPTPHPPTPFCDCVWCKMERDPAYKASMTKATGCAIFVLFFCVGIAILSVLGWLGTLVWRAFA